MNELSPRQLARLARRAHRARRRDLAAFHGLAEDAGIGSRRLRLLTDAWDEAGRAGLQAIGPAPDAGVEAPTQAEADIEHWRRTHFPLDALDVEVWRNRLTVWWLRPDEDPTRPLVRQPLMQLRQSRRGRWHLYRRAVQGEWWPVTVRGRRRSQTLEDCLDHVHRDVLGQFWTTGPTAGHRP